MSGHLRCLIPLSSPVGRKADILSDTAALSKGLFLLKINRPGLAKPELLFPSELPPVSAPRLSAVVWGNWSWPLSPLLPAGHSLRNVTGNTNAIYRPHELLSQCLCLTWHAVQVEQDLVVLIVFQLRFFSILLSFFLSLPYVKHFSSALFSPLEYKHSLGYFSHNKSTSSFKS